MALRALVPLALLAGAGRTAAKESYLKQDKESYLCEEWCDMFKCDEKHYQCGACSFCLDYSNNCADWCFDSMSGPDDLVGLQTAHPETKCLQQNKGNPKETPWRWCQGCEVCKDFPQSMCYPHCTMYTCEGSGSDDKWKCAGCSFCQDESKNCDTAWCPSDEYQKCESDNSAYQWCQGCDYCQTPLNERCASWCNPPYHCLQAGEYFTYTPTDPIEFSCQGCSACLNWPTENCHYMCTLADRLSMVPFAKSAFIALYGKDATYFPHCAGCTTGIWVE
eukprot:CAMPEP_0196690210 /NCGR_PEP_ID=MMETSP1090-20130531/19775_1 /TAXON_ID=37098 /ORGANISM="Isochrysis sp, Strain CCMP1244" /LENGTH=276 /DNA_ID=CAMNT_0042029299 /DNA_START=28 /DNA_END=858 /DNA_ORIENTATION=+